MNRVAILCLFVVGMSFGLKAQSRDQPVDRMNGIKMDKGFIYGEGYHSNEKTAYNNALSDLLCYVNELRFKNGNEHKISVHDIRTLVKQISLFNGNKYNVLVYIPKSEALLMGNDTKTSEPYRNTTSQNTNIESLGPDESTAPGKERTNVSAENLTVAGRSNASINSDILETLCAQDNWLEIRGFIADYIKSGVIKEYGNTDDRPEVPSDAYRIIMDDQRGILAILSPKSSNNVRNLKTNHFDKESNYPNRKVIVWFK